MKPQKYCPVCSGTGWMPISDNWRGQVKRCSRCMASVPAPKPGYKKRVPQLRGVVTR